MKVLGFSTGSSTAPLTVILAALIEVIYSWLSRYQSDTLKTNILIRHTSPSVRDGQQICFCLPQDDSRHARESDILSRARHDLWHQRIPAPAESAAEVVARCVLAPVGHNQLPVMWQVWGDFCLRGAGSLSLPSWASTLWEWPREYPIMHHWDLSLLSPEKSTLWPDTAKQGEYVWILEV